LRTPHASDVQAAAEGLASELTTRSLAAFAAPLFAAEPAPESRARFALEQAQKRRSPAGNPFECFDLPVKSVGDVAVWAHWLERVHGRPSTALWDLPGREGALFASGPLPERAPLFWTLPAQSYPQLYRLGEDTALAPVAGDGERSLAAVFEELARDPTMGVGSTR
jgi:hypothetical protein